jgi:hypothetical protein
MNLSSKITAYDFFAMLIPGLLILILLGNFSGNLPFNCEIATNVWFIIFFLILSYLIGLLWNKLSEFIFCKFRNCEYFIKQQYDKIKLEYGKTSSKEISEEVDKDIKHKYYKAYYSLMKKNCLNNIPVLEAQVAFIRNLLILIPFYIITFIHCDNAIYTFIKSQLHNTLGLVILLLIMLASMFYLLFQLQNKIYYLVWEGNKYLTEN